MSDLLDVFEKHLSKKLGSKKKAEDYRRFADDYLRYIQVKFQKQWTKYLRNLDKAEEFLSSVEGSERLVKEKRRAIEEFQIFLNTFSGRFAGVIAKINYFKEKPLVALIILAITIAVTLLGSWNDITEFWRTNILPVAQTPEATPAAVTIPTNFVSNPTVPPATRDAACNGIAPAQLDEVLVIVTGFNGDKGEDFSGEFYGELSDRVEKSSLANVRVEQLPSNIPLTSKEAVSVGKSCDATIIIWGTVDTFGVKARFELVRYEHLVEVKPDLGVVTALDLSENTQSGEMSIKTDAGKNIPDYVTFQAYVLKGIPNEYEYLILFSLGQIAYFSYEYQQAIDLFTKAAQIELGIRGDDLDLAAVYYYLGEAYASLGDLSSAVQDYEYAIQLDPQDTNVFLARGRAYELLGLSDLASQDYGVALDLCNVAVGQSRASDNYYKRARTYYRLAFYFSASSSVSYFEYLNFAISDLTEAIKLDPHNAELYYWRAESYLNARKYEEALKDYEEATRLDPGYVWAYVGVGYVNGRSHNFDQSFRAFDQAIELNLKYAPIYRNRALIYEMLGETDLAIADYSRTIAYKPSEYSSYKLRGDLFYERRDYQKALKDYEDAIRLNNLYISAYASKAYAYEALGMRSEALSSLREAISICSSKHCLPYAYYEQAEFYEYLGDFEAAIRDYTTSITNNPGYFYAYIQRGDIYNQQNRYDLALEDYNKAIEICERASCIAWVFNSRGYFFEDHEDLNSAIDDYTRAIQIDTRYYWAYANRASANAQKGRLDLALADFERAIEICGSEKSCAWIYNRRGNVFNDYLDIYDAAISDYTNAILLDPDYYAAYGNRGVAYRNSGLNVLALEDNSKALTICEKTRCSAWYYNSRGITLEEMGDKDAAIEAYSRAIQVDPWYYWAYLNRGELYAGMGNYEDALTDLNKSIQINPQEDWLYYVRGDIYSAMYQDGKEEYLRKAIADFAVSIQLDSSNWSSIRYGRNEQYALQLLQDAIVSDPKNLDLRLLHAELMYGENESAMLTDLALSDSLIDEVADYKRRADFYRYTLSDLDSALADYSKLLELDPYYWVNNKYGLEMRAELYLAMGNEEAAKADYDRLVALFAENPMVYFKRAAFYRETLRDLDAALADYSRAIELFSSYKVETGYALVERAELHYETGNVEAAKADYDRLVALDAINPEYHLKRADFYRNTLHDLDVALADYDRIIEVDPLYQIGNEYALVARAGLHHEMGNIEAAEVDYDRLVALDATKIEYYLKRANFYRNTLHDLDAALADYDKIIELDPAYQGNFGVQYYEDKYALVARAELYYEMGNVESAKADYDRLVALDATNLECYLKRADFYRDTLQDLDAALADYDKIIELDPLYQIKNQYALVARAGLHYEMGDIEAAKTDYDRLVALDATNPEYYLKQADFYRNTLQDLDAALADYDKIIELDPAYQSWNEHIFETRAGLYYEMGNVEAAKADYERLVALDASNLDYRLRRADFYRNTLQDLDAALADYDKIIELDPAYQSWNEHIFETRAGLYYEMGDVEAAKADYDRLVALDATNLEYYRRRANFYRYTLHDLDAALADYDKIIELDPVYRGNFSTQPYEDKYALVARAELYYGMSNVEAAKADYDRLVALDATNPECYLKRADFYRNTLHDLDVALGDYSKIIDIDPHYLIDNEYILAIRAELYYEKGDIKAAKADYDYLLALYPSHIPSHIRRAEIYRYDLETFDAALADYSKVIELDPLYEFYSAYENKNEYVLFARAKLYSEMGMKSNCESDINRFLVQIRDLEAGTLQFYLERAQLYRDSLYDLDSAVKDYSEAIMRTEEPTAQLYVERGRIFHDKGEYQAALDDFNEAIKINRYHVEAYIDRGNIKRLLGNINGALDDYNHGLELNPEYAFAYSMRALAYVELGDLHAALIDIDRGIDLGATWPWVYSNRGLINKGLGNFDAAIVDFSKAIEFDSKNAQFYIDRGLLYSMKNYFEWALDDYNDAISLQPQSAYLYMLRGTTYEKMGDLESALVDYTSSLSIDSQLSAAYGRRALIYFKKLKFGLAISDSFRGLSIEAKNHPEIIFIILIVTISIAIYIGKSNFRK